MKFIPSGMPNDNDADDQGPPQRTAPPMPTRRPSMTMARGGKKGGGLAALRKLVMMAHQPRRGAAPSAY